MGPLLFLLYINDMSYISKILSFILFADDTNILYSNSDIWELERLANTDLSILSEWFKANRFSLNIQKTNLVLCKTDLSYIRNIAKNDVYFVNNFIFYLNIYIICFVFT